MGAHSPGRYSLLAALITEVVMTIRQGLAVGKIEKRILEFLPRKSYVIFKIQIRKQLKPTTNNFQEAIICEETKNHPIIHYFLHSFSSRYLPFIHRPFGCLVFRTLCC
jgi:hypothetical protein